MKFASSCFRNNVIVSLKKFNKISKFFWYTKRTKPLKRGSRSYLTTPPPPPYGHRNTFDFAARRIKTVRYGSESLSYLGPRLWNILPDEYKKIQSVKDFKAKIRWVPENCPFRLYKIYILHVGFI